MLAWQLLQGNIPSVMGGGVTGNSSPAPLAKDVKHTPDKSIPKNIALVTFFIFTAMDRWGRRSLAVVSRIDGTKNLPDSFNKTISIYLFNTFA